MRDPEDLTTPSPQRFRRGVSPPLRAGGRARFRRRGGRRRPLADRARLHRRRPRGLRPLAAGRAAGMGRRSGRPLPRALDGAAGRRGPPVRGPRSVLRAGPGALERRLPRCCARARRWAGSTSSTRTGLSGSTCWSGSPAVPRLSPRCCRRRALSRWSGRGRSCGTGLLEKTRRGSEETGSEPARVRPLPAGEGNRKRLGYCGGGG